MQSNLFLYLTAMSAVSLHNLVNNINEVTRSVDTIELKTSATNWTLDNTSKLIRRFPNCNGTRQSPININTSTVKQNLNLRLSLTAYDKPISGLLINQFPTFRLVPAGFEWPRPNSVISNSLARSFNPFADSHFVLQYVQFFWSSDGGDEESSLHRVNGVGFPLEIHFVHMNTKYTNIDEAFKMPEGLLILSALAVPSTHESYLFDRILEELANISRPIQQVPLEEDSTWRGLLPADTSRFYRYQGSMILPPCHESVQWIVFEDKLKLGQRQLKRMKRYKFVGKDLSQNNKEIDWTSQRRPLQNLKDRQVERSFSLNTNIPKLRNLPRQAS